MKKKLILSVILGAAIAGAVIAVKKSLEPLYDDDDFYDDEDCDEDCDGNCCGCAKCTDGDEDIELDFDAFESEKTAADGDGEAGDDGGASENNTQEDTKE